MKGGNDQNKIEKGETNKNEENLYVENCSSSDPYFEMRRNEENLEEPIHYIKLNRRNMTKGKLPNSQNFIALCDSGATVNVISASFIQNSSYLSHITPNVAPKINLIVGNGSRVTTTKTLEFTCNIQGHVFTITAYIIPSIGGIEVIIGTEALRELKAELNFENNMLKFRSGAIPVYVLQDIIIKPGEAKVIAVK